MKCVLCPVPGRLTNGRSNLAQVNTASGPQHVCQDCARLCASAWARKVRRELPPNPTKPTAPPTGDTAPAVLAERALKVA